MALTKATRIARQLHVTAHQGHSLTGCPLCAATAQCDRRAVAARETYRTGRAS